MQVRFWGTRGSIAAPGLRTYRYGGNTSCVEVRTTEGTLIIFDCGTGARELGLALAGFGPVRAHLLVTHTHMDHIQGLPFFVPAFMPGSHLTIYGPAGIDRSFPSAIGGQMEYSYFPVPITDLPARVDFQELGEGTFAIGEVQVRAQYLNHTAPCLGYRLEVGGATLVYATDHEPHAPQLWRPDRPPDSYEIGAMLHQGDRRHAELLRGADLLIHDAQYTEAEYPARRGWGHSTVEYVVDLALAAGVKRLALFHHDPTRNDDAVDALLELCRARVAASGRALEVVAADEGAELTLEEPTHPTATGVTPAPPRLPERPRVLVGDDDPDVAYLLESALQEDGYQVRVVRTGGEVLEQARHDAFDLILLDVTMPELDGFAVCRALRADPRLARVPIVMLTARSDEQDVMAGFAEGVTDYMTKPFALSQFRARVRSWLTRAAAPGT
jgi:CheY-like chemotaxis protein/phosphoribosyl 1,2-cyclic phosphodiesterase